MTDTFERRRLRVYVAGPMSGDLYEGVQRGITMGRRMFLDGLAPFVPHFDAYWFLPDGGDQAARWAEYLTYDLEWVAVSDAVFRLGGVSRGADKECAVAQELDIPVFYEVVVGDYDRLLGYAEAAGLSGKRRASA